MNTLPVSPYPAPQYTPIRAHFVVDQKPDDTGWKPWVGGTWSKWVKGKVLGYRDFAGREAEVFIFLFSLAAVVDGFFFAAWNL